MTIRHLNIFTSVADLGGMSKAARALHISQPSISQAISELERYYGVKLFERLSQKLYLTKEGELLLSFSRHILDSFNQMEEAMNQAAQKKTIKIGCSVSVGTCLINNILDEAEQHLPNCRFEVVVSNSTEIELAVLKNEVDLAIAEGVVTNENLIITPICEDELVVVCGKEHRLAHYDAVTLDMLHGQNYVSRESGSTNKNQFTQIMEERGYHLHPIFQSTNTEAIKNAVLHGRGVAIFSRRMVEKEVASGEMVILPMKDVSVKRTFDLILHKNKYISPEIKQMMNLLCNR